MKFLCPQCKAKYRIADEKLAQRNSSRMKCRKCGHVIDIHAAAVPESIRPPGAPDPDDDEDGMRASSARLSSEPPAPKAATPRPPEAKPAPGAKSAPGGRPASVVAKPAVSGAAGKGLAPPPRRSLSGTPLAPSAVPKRPATVGPSPKRPVAGPPRRGATGAVAVAQAVAEKPAPASEPKAAPLRASVPPPKPPDVVVPARSDMDDDAPTRIHDGAALAAAFSLSVDGTSVASTASSSSAQQEEWYVGIDGSPVGPLTVVQLREKAASGKATPESLVWKDGFEEWKPLKEFPELIAVVEESKAGSSAAPTPAPSPIVIPSPAPAPVFPPSPAVEAKSGEKSERKEHSIMERFSLRPRKPQVSHPMAWAGVIVALALGVTIGIVLFSKTEQKEVVKYVEVPASAKAQETPTEAPQTLDEATISGVATTKKGNGTTAKVDPTPVATTGKGLAGLSGLNGLNGLGPATGGPDVASTPVPGGQLDGAAISRVVSNFTPSVRRGCWDPALVSRSPDAPSSARVAVAITIAPSGSVENVTTSGDPKGYPNLAHCIESKVRSWKFPRSSGTTTANVPFVFAAQ